MVKYIVLKATTTSEWDNVTYGLLPLPDKKRLTYFKRLRKRLEKLKVELNVYALSVFSDEIEYVVDSNETISIKEDNSPITLVNETIMESFERPEQAVRYGQMKFTPTQILFISHGKHTDEEFSCKISYKDLFGE